MTGTSFSRVVRIAWLLARFIRRDTVRFDSYRERFAASPRTFFRDIAALRDAGIYVEVDGSGYRMLCFRSEREAA
jgi:predicted DNA-binding transcriptional regulator YafY